MTFLSRRPRVVLIAVLGVVLVGAGVFADGRLANRDPAAPTEPRSVVVLSRDSSIKLPYVLSSSEASGCPRFSVSSPVTGRTATPGSIGSGVALHRTPLASVNVACIGRTSEVGTAEEIATRPRPTDPGSAVYGNPMTVRSAFGEAVRTEVHWTKTDMLLTEWWVDRAGWVYAVGYLRRGSDNHDIATVEAMLTSWTWT